NATCKGVHLVLPEFHCVSFFLAGRGRDAGYPPPRPDPGVRHSRTGLLPWVVTRRPPKMPTVRRRARVTGSPRRCIRLLVGWTTFPWASPLLSTSSARPGAPAPWFRGFLDTMARSDSLHPCITGVSLGGTVRPWHPGQARGRASRV